MGQLHLILCLRTLHHSWGDLRKTLLKYHWAQLSLISELTFMYLHMIENVPWFWLQCDYNSPTLWTDVVVHFLYCVVHSVIHVTELCNFHSKISSCIKNDTLECRQHTFRNCSTTTTFSRHWLIVDTRASNHEADTVSVIAQFDTRRRWDPQLFKGSSKTNFKTNLEIMTGLCRTLLRVLPIRL